MSNENRLTLYERTKRYLVRSSLHIVAFTALIIVHEAIANPASLHAPTVLFVSLMSIILLVSLQINHFNKAMNVFTYHSIASNHVPSEKSHRLKLFNTMRSTLMFAANLILTGFTITYALLAPSGTTAIALGLITYHLLHSVRDYLTDRNALEFINRYFKITMNNDQNTKILNSSLTLDDPSELHIAALNLSDEIKEKYQLTCQIEQIMNNQLEVGIGAITDQVMYQPVHLVSKSDPTVHYWVDYNNLIDKNNIHVIQKDFIVTHEHDPITQEKTRQIRTIIIETSAKLKQMRKLQSSLRMICNQESLQSYRQAIATTNEDIVPDNHQMDTEDNSSDSETIMNQIKQSMNQWVDQCQQHDIEITNIPQSEEYANQAQSQRTPARCSITYQYANIPLIIKLTDQATGKTTQFHCDAQNLLNWLDCDPNDNEQKNDASNTTDLQEIETLLQNQEKPIPLSTAHQLREIQERISPEEPSNPIALLLKQHQEDCVQALDILLSSHHMRCRIHDRDLLTTLSDPDQRYFSLSEYLDTHQLYNHYALIVSKCYAEDTSIGIKKLPHLNDNSSEASLLNKRWPMHRMLMISHETDMQIRLDLEEAGFQNQHAIRVMQHVLKPKINEIKDKIITDEEYYIRSDHGFACMRGKEITPVKLLELSLFGERTTISKNPLDQESFLTGINFNNNDGPLDPTSDFEPAARVLFPTTPGSSSN